MLSYQPYIAVIDYSKGNLRSVQKGLCLAGANALITADPDEIVKADAVVLPGVGSFADASAVMESSGQMQVIRERVQAGIPFLGICLGLQLLFERGSEGLEQGDKPSLSRHPGLDPQSLTQQQWAPGLGLLSGWCERVAATDAQGLTYKIPHVGWNQTWYSDPTCEYNSSLFTGITDGSNFYYTHSYQAMPQNTSDVAAQVTHAQTFTAAVQQGHIMGTQFHPEKSSHKGLAVLKNFVQFVRNEG